MKQDKHLIIRHYINYLFLTFLLLVSKPIFANDLYHIKPYIDFSAVNTKNNAWLSPAVNTAKENELFFTNTQGEIYRAANGKVEAAPFINLSQQLTPKIQKHFTAITLHPNFHVFDQKGTNIIYTAHVEQYNAKVKRRRLSEEAIEALHSHDTVIIEWELNNLNSNRVNIARKREVLRIATPSAETRISQLSFNPFLKSWNDDFGLLYIALKSAAKENKTLEKSPLYSGSILRIKPDKFGLKPYTVPHNNPFTTTQHIHNEIIVTGAQEIHQFTWSKQTKNKLIVTHQYNKKQLISVSSLGSNYQITPPKKILHQSNDQSAFLSNVYYKNREISTLWNKLVLVTKANNQWKINTLSVDLVQNSESALKEETALDSKNFPLAHQVFIYLTHAKDLLIWDKSQTTIYKIQPSKSITNTVEKVAAPNEEENSNTLLYLIAIAVLIVLIFIFIRNKNNQVFLQAKSMLQASFSHFEFDAKANTVALFKRHENTVDTSLSINDITSSTIYLNDMLLNRVTPQADSGFNDKKENTLRISFQQEHRDKMVDDKIRKITLKLKTAKQGKFLICAYLREGNQRLTKDKYHSVIEQLVDWHWYLSSKINPNETPKRVIKVPLPAKAAVAPVAPKPAPATKPNEPVIKPKIEVETAVEVKTTPAVKNKPTTEASTNTPTEKVDTVLIDALNKLVTLKEQGHLTEEEFNLAKSNLLDNLNQDT